jgi:hypothetical protein
MHVIMFVSKTVDQALKVADIWIKVGVKGITILESAGMQQVSQQGIRDDVGLVFSISAVMRAHEVHHRTLFSVVNDQEMIDRVVAATTEYVGDWSHTDVGIMFVWPLAQAWGLSKHAH